MTTVMSNMALVLDLWMDSVRTNHIGATPLRVAYDDTLEYEGAIGKFRSRNKMLAEEKPQAPILIFNRSVLQHHPDRGKRITTQDIVDVYDTSQGLANIYKVVYGMLEINFAFTSVKLSDLEQFEIAYQSGAGIKQDKDLDLDLTSLGLGVWMYYMRWGDLETKEILTEGSFRKAVTGQLLLYGFYLLLELESEEVIKEIDTLTRTLGLEETLNSQQITG